MKVLEILGLAALLAVSAMANSSPVIYGTVVDESDDEYTGALRWEEEEVYWIHAFNGRHDSPFDVDQLPAERRDEVLDSLPGPTVELDGNTVEFAKWLGGNEIDATDFSIPFGSIDRLVRANGKVTVHLVNGDSFDVDGGSNDIGADIEIRRTDGSDKIVKWRNMREVRFFQAPDDMMAKFPPQLFGHVTTVSGEATGLFIWDAYSNEEREAADELDGEDPDGEDYAIEMGKIARITKAEQGVDLILRNGDTLNLDGTNDVNAQNSGLLLISPALGRITVPWDAFVAVELSDLPDGFLPSKSYWDQWGRLTGTVHADGRQVEGEITYDLDERYQADHLDGRAGGLRYELPFGLIRSIERRPREVIATTREGLRFALAGDRDVGVGNTGLIVDSNGEIEYFSWDEVDLIEFD